MIVLKIGDVVTIRPGAEWYPGVVSPVGGFGPIYEEYGTIVAMTNKAVVVELSAANGKGTTTLPCLAGSLVTRQEMEFDYEAPDRHASPDQDERQAGAKS